MDTEKMKQKPRSPVVDKVLARLKAGEVICLFDSIGFQTKIGIWTGDYATSDLKTLRYDTYCKVVYGPGSRDYLTVERPRYGLTIYRAA